MSRVYETFSPYALATAAVSGGAAPQGLSTAHISARAAPRSLARGIDVCGYRGSSKDLYEVRAWPGLLECSRVVEPTPRALDFPAGRGRSRSSRSCRRDAGGQGVTTSEGDEPPAIRGRVCGFSKASRRRLLRRFAKLDRDARPVMITLTYPAAWDPDWRGWKKHLDNWFRRFFRFFPHAAAIWKLEYQKRGAPHFHLLVWNVPCSVAVKAWVSKSWFDVVGSGDDKHLRAGTRVELVRSWRVASAYCAKYLGKLDAERRLDGRIWGIRNPGNLPHGDCQSVTLNVFQVSRLSRWVRRTIPLRHVQNMLRKRLSWTVFRSGGDWYHAAVAISKMSDNIYYVNLIMVKPR